MVRRRTMIPSEIFTSTGQKAQCIVCKNDVWTGFWVTELCKHLPSFRVAVFCSTWAIWDPLSSQILHNACIPMTLARSTFFAEDFVVDCDDVAKLDRAEHVTQYGECKGPF